MCGIAGIFLRDDQCTCAMLKGFTYALGHRGPNAAGTYCSGPAGLAHTRLSIIDLEGGNQPLHTDDGELSLIANGEVYNFVELRGTLEATGATFRTRSDSETILHAYRSWGLDGLKRLNGMFAFALWDAGRRELVLARDRLGIKPLFYARLPDGVAFASEIKALLPLLPETPEVNPPALIQYLQSQFNTGEETIFKGVYRVLPGEALTIDTHGNTQRRRYWSATEVQPRDLSFQEAAREFDDLMDTVIREHMRSDVPYGLFLSGGVDSGVLLALLHRHLDHPVRTFTVGYTGTSMAGELEGAARIAGLFGADHSPLVLDRKTVFERLVHNVWVSDDLMRDYACLPTSLLAQRAGRDLKVVFTGEGADEVFAGYGRYRKTGVQRWAKNLVAPGSGGFRTRGHWRRPWPRKVFGPHLRGVQDAVREPFVRAWRSTPGCWSDLQRSQYTDLTTALPDNLLVKVDRMLMGFGLEGRVPFLDHRVVEFGLSLPDELKVRPGRGKLFLKRWAEKHLPHDHLYRKKRGFHVPVGDWLQGDLLNALARRLPRNEAIRAWFEPRGVAELFSAHGRGKDAGREIWGLMQFAIWHRLFIEEPGRTPAPEEDPLAWID